MLRRPELLATVLESAPDAIILVNMAGIIEFASHQIQSLLGYAPEEVVGQPIEMLLPERFRKVHLGHRRNYAHAARVRPMGVDLDLYALRRNGEEMPVEISLSPISCDDEPLVAAALRDVTERRRVQTELKLAREEAERANQAKSRFLATASHDLRQPLQSLSLLNGALRRMAGDPTLADAVAQQGKAIDAMSRLLNALLDISKLESGAIRPDPTDFTVAPLFEEMRAEFAGVAAGKGLELRVSTAPLCVHSDPSLVGQIVRNLVSNAIKYTRTGWVELRAVPRHTEGVSVEVADTGIGIPQEQLPYIYDEFYQVGVASNTTREGYGLGLSIVSRLVTLLGLKLEVRSQVGHGSVFSLALPAGVAAARTEASRQAHPPEAPLSTAQAILLVEDDAGVRAATGMLLKVEGYRVLPAGSLTEAAEKARDAGGFDLLITDYHLAQRSTGLDVIAAMRGIVGDHLKAIVVTGDTSSAIRDLAADPLIRLARKPVQADQLLALVRELLPRTDAADKS